MWASKVAPSLKVPQKIIHINYFDYWRKWDRDGYVSSNILLPPFTVYSYHWILAAQPGTTFPSFVYL